MMTLYYEAIMTHNDVISVSNRVIFKTIRLLRLLMQFLILIAVFVCLAHILHIFLFYFNDLLIFE